MPAQLSLSAARIIRLDDAGAEADVVHEAAQIVVRGSIATITEHRQRSSFTGVASCTSPAKGVWVLSTAQGQFRVERVVGKCCGKV